MTDGAERGAAFVCEMANKYKEETLLPMNIWIDETRSYVRDGQGKRVWFQLDTAEDLQDDNTGSMDLDGKMHLSSPGTRQLTERDLAALRNFVHNNRYALERVADQEVRLYRIWPDMIKGGGRASEAAINALNVRVDRLAGEKDGKAESLCEMAKVADFNGYKLVVWTNDEGATPHFHVMAGKDLRHPEFDACVKFRVAEYYPHDGTHTDRLPDGQAKAMVDLLKSRDPFAIGEQTVWQTLLVEWNRNDNREKISVDTPMPDYGLLARR